MNTKFTTTCNFHLPTQYKEEEILKSIAYAIAFEEARSERLSPEKMSVMLQVLIDRFAITYYIKPFGNDAADWEMIKDMYIKYLDFRAMNYKPLVSITLTGLYFNGVVLNQIKINEITEEFSKNRLLSLESDLV